MRYLVLAIMLAIVCSCKSGKDAAAASEPAAAITAPDSITKAAKEKTIMSMPSHRVVVSFISIGAGPDSKGKEILAKYLDESETKFKVALAFVSKGWGREGESDFLFPLDELNASQQEEFIGGLRELFLGNELIHIEENRPMRGYR
jgi:hypothetical protein